MICCPHKTHLRFKDTYRLKMKKRKKIFQENGNQKKAWVATLILDKIVFKSKTILRDIEGH